MGRTINKLTDTVARSAALKPGRHSDGAGLYLNVSPTGSKSWIFMWAVGGRRREMGLGAYPAISLAKARKMASENREAVAEGRDPIAERAREAEPTFGECADLVIASMEGVWRNDKHRYQWSQTLGPSYCKAIRDRDVSAITTEDVLKVLKPIWVTKAETASRVRGRIERVLDFAKARGWRSGENPALWRGHLSNILPSPKRHQTHFAAMPYEQLPEFLVRVRAAEATAARALEFTILTASRSGETRGAVWAEIDFDKAVWTIPAQRMKAGKEHRVPLSSRAVEILRSLAETRTGHLIFPTQNREAPLSDMAMTMFLRRLKVAVTVHGFRSAFRDWCGNETGFPREVAEQALGSGLVMS